MEPPLFVNWWRLPIQSPGSRRYRYRCIKPATVEQTRLLYMCLCLFVNQGDKIKESTPGLAITFPEHNKDRHHSIISL